jgi:Mg2+ and Co2+ transporter CorA
MAKEKGSNVDAEVKNELLQIEIRLNSTLQDLIAKLSSNLTITVEKVFNKDIEHINEKLNHFQNNHREHFENDKDRRKDIDDLEKLLNNLSTSIQIQEKTKDKIEEKTDRKKNTNYGFIVMLCTIFMVLGVVVGFII